MIEIHSQDNIIDIVEKIEENNSQELILFFPVWHPILHNHLSLKIIQSKSKNKNITIHTNDVVWKKICKNIGIHINKHDINRNSAFPNIMNHNFTIKEYFFYILWQYRKKTIDLIINHKKIHQITNYSQNHGKSFKVFIIIFIFSLVLFWTVYYIAISKTTVIISPETSVRKEALNFILRQDTESSILGNNNTIRLEKITKKFFTSNTYSATSIKIDEQWVSKGRILITNITQEAIVLRPETRFEDSKWNVFRSKKWINIPSGTQDWFWDISAWEVEIIVIADLKDTSWNFIWKSGNISMNTSLILPGLNQESKALIYAVSIENFTGGNNDIIKIISKEDIDSTKLLFKEKLEKEAYNSLKNETEAYNTENNSWREIFTWNNSITYSDIRIKLEEWITPWIIKDNFTYTWEITISAFIYNNESIIQKLKTVINEKTIVWYEKIKSINEDSLRLSEILYSEWNWATVKATFEIETLKYYDIWRENSSFINTLKAKIKWKDMSEAENILINDSKISSAEITNRPFFIKKVSSMLNNIIIKVQL